MRYFPLALGKEDKVISKRLEPNAVPAEPALSCLGFAVDVSEFLSRTKNLAFQKERKGKLAWTLCGDKPDNRRASNPCLNGAYSPRPVSSSRHLSLSEYSFVVSLWNPGHRSLRSGDVDSPSVKRSSTTRPYLSSVSRKNDDTPHEPQNDVKSPREGER